MTLHADGALAEAATEHADVIAGEVLATDWTVLPLTDAPGGAADLDVDGQRFAVALAVV